MQLKASGEEKLRLPWRLLNYPLLLVQRRFTCQALSKAADN